MSQQFMANDIDIVSNGTSNHMFLGQSHKKRCYWKRS